MGFSSYEIEKYDFKVSQGKQIRTKNKESFEYKVMKQSNIALQLPLPSSFRKLAIITFTKSSIACKLQASKCFFIRP